VAVDSALLPLLFVAGLGVVVVVGVLAWLADKRRREELAAFAAEHGWTWVQRDDRWCDAFEGAPFGLGHKRQAHNVLTGTHDGRRFVAFDYVYHTTETSTDAQGRTSQREVSHWYSVVGLGVGAAVPALSVAPENFFGRALGKLTNRDIELESEEFNRAFTVRCRDRKFAFDVLHPRVMEYLLTVRDVAWRTTNGWAVVIEKGRHKPAEVLRAVGVLDRVLDQVPAFVREQYGIPDEHRTEDGQ
jgi:hypothetical protein